MLIVTKQTSLLCCLIFFMETFIRGNWTKWSPARLPQQAFGEVPFPFHWTQPPAPPIIPATVQMFKTRRNISDISKRRWNIWDIFCNTLTVQKRSNLDIYLCELPDRNPLILVVVELLEDLVNVFLRLVLLTISLHCHESHLKLLVHSIYYTIGNF